MSDDIKNDPNTIDHIIDVIYGDTDSIFLDSSYFENEGINVSKEEIKKFGNLM
jgi:hypothetical protein